MPPYDLFVLFVLLVYVIVDQAGLLSQDNTITAGVPVASRVYELSVASQL